MSDVRACTTPELTHKTRTALRAMLHEAFEGDFSDDDWDHSVGGRHFLIEDDDEVLAHASVVTRTLETGGRAWTVGYVEAVAVAPSRQARGLGTRVMRPATRHIDETYLLGALSTDAFGFYESLGWQRWRGRTFVKRDGVLVPTPSDDGEIMVRLTSRVDDLDLDAPIACDDRAGDVW